MRRFSSILRRGRTAILGPLPILVFSVCASAQFGAAPPATSEATPLPLSGRTASSGGVLAGESPVPSTTTSVNTLNPTVSVQGAYAGSARSTTQMPFTGNRPHAMGKDSGAGCPNPIRRGKHQ